MTWAALQGSRAVTGEQAFWGYQELRMLTREVVQRFDDFDVYLCPVMSAPPPPIGFTDPATVPPREIGKRQTALFPFAALFNFTGQPSLSLPLGMSDRRPADRDDVHRPLCRRGDAVPAGRAAREGDAVGAAPPAGMGMSEWRNWSGSVVAHPAAIARPRDEGELAALVRGAGRVRVTGAGHSFMPLCETTGTLVSLSDMAGEMIVARERRERGRARRVEPEAADAGACGRTGCRCRTRAM